MRCLIEDGYCYDCSVEIHASEVMLVRMQAQGKEGRECLYHVVVLQEVNDQ